MLILVGVTVTVAINGGLFEKSKEATQKTLVAREKEELTAAIATAYSVEAEKIDKEKLEKTLGTGWSVSKGEGELYTVISSNKNQYKITSNGIVPENALIYMYCPKEDCTEETHLHKGDYVNYKPAIAQSYDPDKGETIGKYTGYTTEAGAVAKQNISQDTSLKWRVLGMNEKNEILLISKAPTGSLKFYGYVGYNNYENVLNEACEALYGNAELEATARSITMDDIDKYLGGSNYPKTTFGGGSNTALGYGYQNADAITSKFKYDKKTNTLTKEDNTIPAKDLTSTAYNYKIDEYIESDINKKLIRGEDVSSPYNYYVASRTISVQNGNAFWVLGYVVDGNVYTSYHYVCYAVGSERSRSGNLRPIVSLPSNITIDQL